MMKVVEEQFMWDRLLKPCNFFKVSRKIKNFLSSTSGRTFNVFSLSVR